jgi:glycosyltransferase involved in cell wall biosynthesis
MLAYNQEKLVEEALRGALGQDYPNLEIVVSDDASADGTFDVIRRVADSYAGPHRLIVNRMPSNVGIFPHLYAAVGLSSGALIVGAAGDDISYPHRVSRLAEHWLRTGADALFSDWDVIGEEGEPIRQGRPRVRPMIDPGVYFPDRKVEQIMGVGSAYDRSVFDAVPLPDSVNYGEDFFFTLMLALKGRTIAYVDERLVAYRQHGGSTTNQPTTMTVEAAELSRQQVIARVVPMLRYFERAALSGEGVDGRRWPETVPVDLGRLRSDIAFLELRARWDRASPLERLGALVGSRSRDQLRWIVPRLLGIRALALAKALLRRGR